MTIDVEKIYLLVLRSVFLSPRMRAKELNVYKVAYEYMFFNVFNIPSLNLGTLKLSSGQGTQFKGSLFQKLFTIYLYLKWIYLRILL